MVYPFAMPASPKPDSQDARAERLAAALRENLKRRKAQAREMARAQTQAKEPTKDAEKEEP
jgi:hypothetical protein